MLEAIKTKVQIKNPTSKKNYNMGYLGHIKKIAQDLMKSTDEIHINVLESTNI